VEPPENVLSANRLGYFGAAILLFALGCAAAVYTAEVSSDDGYDGPEGGYTSEFDSEFGSDYGSGGMYP
jgi:hypothetical protein